MVLDIVARPTMQPNPPGPSPRTGPSDRFYPGTLGCGKIPNCPALPWRSPTTPGRRDYPTLAKAFNILSHSAFDVSSWRRSSRIPTSASSKFQSEHVGGLSKLTLL